MYEHRITKFIFTVRENADGDDNCEIPYVVWPMQDETRERLAKLGKLARDEQITIVTNEFQLYDGSDMEQPLFSSLSISYDAEQTVGLEMEKLVKKMWPVAIVTDEDIALNTALMAVGTPNHMKSPVALVPRNCTTDLLVFDEEDIRINDLYEAVDVALEIFEEISDPASALNEFCEATGIKHAYRYSRGAPEQA